MKLNLETKYNIHDVVEYKRVDTFAFLEGKEPQEEIIQSEIETIDIQVGTYGNIYVRYGLKNEDETCADCITKLISRW